jgi:hypothetical protein
MYMHVKHRQKSERIALPPIGLHTCSNKRLAQNQFRKFMQIKKVRICLEKLTEESFESLVIDLGVWVEEFKVDVDKGSVLLAGDWVTGMNVKWRETYGIAVRAFVVGGLLFSFRHFLR